MQIVDAAPHYGLLSVQGPKAAEVVRALDLFPEIPTQAAWFRKNFRRHARRNLSGEQSAPSSSVAARVRRAIRKVRTAHVASTNVTGFDLFVPNNSLGAVADKLIAAAKQIGGRAVRLDGVRDRAHRGGHSAIWRGHGRDEHPARMRHREPRRRFTTKAATSGRKSSTASTASAT